MGSPESGSHGDVVAAIFVRGTSVLLCHRHPLRLWQPNVWDLPGGHVEPGEQPEIALVREVIEELGVIVRSLGTEPLLDVSDEQVRLRAWQVDRWSGEPMNRAPSEHDRIGWFTLDKALRLSLAHPAYRPLLERVLAANGVDPPAPHTP